MGRTTGALRQPKKGPGHEPRFTLQRQSPNLDQASTPDSDHHHRPADIASAAPPDSESLRRQARGNHGWYGDVRLRDLPLRLPRRCSASSIGATADAGPDRRGLGLAARGDAVLSHPGRKPEPGHCGRRSVRAVPAHLDRPCSRRWGGGNRRLRPVYAARAGSRYHAAWAVRDVRPGLAPLGERSRDGVVAYDCPARCSDPTLARR